MRKIGWLPVVALALAGCASGFNPVVAAKKFGSAFEGVKPVFEFSIELYSVGKPTPPHVVVPQEVINVGGLSRCSPCGSGVYSSGTGTRSGSELGPDGYRRVYDRIR